MGLREAFKRLPVEGMRVRSDDDVVPFDSWSPAPASNTTEEQRLRAGIEALANIEKPAPLPRPDIHVVPRGTQ